MRSAVQRLGIGTHQLPLKRLGSFSRTRHLLSNTQPRPQLTPRRLAGNRAQSSSSHAMSSSSNELTKECEGGAPSTEQESATATSSVSELAKEPKLPPLSAQEFRTYNRLAVRMDYFHDHFRSSWKLLYGACTSGKRPSGMSLKQFIDEGISLTQYLETHHGIEETYLYPILARKMPEFRTGKGNQAAELLQQHRLIHKGMDAMADYLRACRNRELDLELSVLKEKMDSWEEVLMKHLDQEVESLGAENMRKYWTVDEMKTIPI